MNGWGIPMATDIAFALGILALVGDRVPVGLKVFLTALAIVDDIAAIGVIAIFYTDAIAVTSLAIGALFLGLAFAANRAGVRSSPVYFVIGAVVWLAFLKSGVHATLAAVLMAFTIPSRPLVPRPDFSRAMRDALDSLDRREPDASELCPDQQHAIDSMARGLAHTSAPLVRVEHSLAPLVAFIVLPVFALANAGVSLSADLGAALADPITVGVVLGLLVGKPLGIFGTAWLAVRMGLARLPEGVRWTQVAAVSILGGVGFTMALFIEGLAFTDPAQREAAKIGILLASLITGIIGYLAVRRTTAAPETHA